LGIDFETAILTEADLDRSVDLGRQYFGELVYLVESAAENPPFLRDFKIILETKIYGGRKAILNPDARSSNALALREALCAAKSLNHLSIIPGRILLQDNTIPINSQIFNLAHVIIEDYLQDLARM